METVVVAVETMAVAVVAQARFLAHHGNKTYMELLVMAVKES